MEQQLSNAAVAAVGVAAVGSLGTWVIIAQRLRQQGEVIAPAPRRNVTWHGWHVLLVFLAYLALQPLALSLSGVKLPAIHDPAKEAAGAGVEQALANLPAEDVARLMAYSSLFTLVSVLIGAWLLMAVTGARQEDLGLTSNHAQVGRDAILGAFGFMASTLPVLGVQFIVVKLVEYDHPVLKMLGDGASDRLWLVALLSAVVVAPLAEEFLFRVVLQGWLERVASRAKRMPEAISPDALGTDSEAANASETDAGEPRRALDEPRSGVGAVGREIDAGGRGSPQAVWPIWGSAAIFALMHVGQGAAPIPLLLLGAILGYVYRQTHRLVPCVVLHALFNLFSLLIFRLSVAS